MPPAGGQAMEPPMSVPGARARSPQPLPRHHRRWIQGATRPQGCATAVKGGQAGDKHAVVGHGGLGDDGARPRACGRRGASAAAGTSSTAAVPSGTGSPGGDVFLDGAGHAVDAPQGSPWQPAWV